LILFSFGVFELGFLDSELDLGFDQISACQIIMAGTGGLPACATNRAPAEDASKADFAWFRLVIVALKYICNTAVNYLNGHSR
jgi:hypothetical protein